MSTTREARQGFAICIENQACDDLEVGKVYRILSDKKALDAGHLRVIDDSGEDYLYPASYFVFVQLPLKARRALGTARPGSTSRTP